MRRISQPPVLNFGEGFMLVDVGWKAPSKGTDDVYYKVWVRGQMQDWATANAPRDRDETGEVGWRQYAYLGRVREGTRTEARLKLSFGYRPAGLSSYPVPEGDAGKGQLFQLPETLPLSPGKYAFTLCVQRIGPAGAIATVAQPFEVTIVGDASRSLTTCGISDDQVFQRTAKDKGDVQFYLGGNAGKTWKAVVDKDGQTIVSASGTLNASPAPVFLRSVPVGGPYEVQITAGAATRSFKNLYVGDVWIISGQSNAVGCGNDQSLGAKPIPGVQCLEPRYGIYEWTVARDGLFQQTVGAWITAAQGFYQQTHVPVGLVGHAVGSKPIDYFLDPAGTDAYFLRPLIERHGIGAAAFFWYQGESDALQPDLQSAYPAKLKRLADAVRSSTRNPQLMIGICQLGRYGWFKDDHFAAIREAQRRFVLSDHRSVLYATLPYEINAKDKIHLETPSYLALGRQIAGQMVELERNGQVQTPGPVVRQAQFTSSDHRQIAISFTGAQGLRGNASISEWFVTDGAHHGFRDGGFVGIAAVHIDADAQQVLLDLAATPVGKVSVSYGYRCDIGGSLTNGKGYPAAGFVDVPVTTP